MRTCRFGHAALGTSASYVTCVSYAHWLLVPNADAMAPYLKTFRGLGQLWQVFTVAGVAMGAYTSAQLSGAPMRC